MKRWILAAALGAACLTFAQGQTCTIADFTKPHKWGNPHHVTNVFSSEKGLSFTIDGEDPWFFGPAVEVPAVPAEPRRLMFAMTCEPTSRASCWQLFFAPSGRPFTEKMSCRLYPVGNPPYTRFATRGAVPFNLKGPSHFRLDPPPGSNETFMVKNLTMEWHRPLWRYAPQKVPPLVIPASTPLVLKGKEWELRHDPDRIGAFRFISRGKTVENLPEEPFVYVDKAGKVCTLDWSQAKMNRQVNMDGGITTEATTTDVDGRRWWIRRHFMADKANDALAVLTRIEAEMPKDSGEPAKALHVPALTLFVDRASNGHKHQAMLAGVEYLDDEPSSNTKEIRTHEHNRLIPAEYRLSAPMAAFTKDGSWFAALWMDIEKIKKTCAGPSQCATVFDTPDRLFKSGGHLLAFWAPAVGSARSESELDVYESVPLRKLEHLALFKAGEGESVADAIEAWLSGKTLLKPDTIDQTAALEQLAHGWLDSAIREGVKFKHAIGGNFKPNLVADAPVLMQHLASALDREPKGDKQLAARLRSVAAEVLAAVPKRDVGFTSVSHVRRPAPVLVAGDVPAYLARKAAELKSGNVSLASGKRIWKPQPGKPDFGETLGAAPCNGYTAMALDGLLSAATWSGDEAEIAKALAIVDKATALYHGTVPRGAQPWEMPLHTPDIMASAHLVRIYTLAYLLKPDPAYLREARHWAYGGLSMVYLVPPPFDFGEDVKPVGLYATCAVMGATRWVAPNWIGRPVQWCGLVYSAALWDLARIEPDDKARTFWRNIATGITVSGARQNHTADEPRFVGLLPDSWNLEHQSRYPIPINPGTVQENFAEYVQMPFYFLCALQGGTDGKPSLIHVPGSAEALPPTDGALRCKIASWSDKPAQAVVTRMARPQKVLLDGKMVDFTYLPARRALVVELPRKACGVLEIRTAPLGSLRVGVYTDVGARGSVLAFSRLAALSPDCEAKFIDGAAVRAGALSGVDVLLMSGGSSVDISASLGDEGRAALERFIREGGGYLGTCAGALLMMETAKYKGLGIIPYTRVEAPPRGGGTIKTIWADCAHDLAGITPGIHTTTYHRGPVMTPCEGHPRLGDFTVMARFGCNILTTKLDPDCPSMGGYASCIAGKYGKGKVWVFSDHPEVNPHTMDLVVGGIRYLTGRTIRFVRDQKQTGQFVVGCPTSFSSGAEGAAFAMELVKDPDFHVRGGGFALSSADAVVICDSPDASRLKKLAAPAGVRDLKRFLERGGHVVAWGRGAKCVSGMVKDGDGLHFVKGPAEAMETLRALRKRPLPPVPAPTFGAALPRAEGAVRTGFLLGSGSSGACLFRLLRTIAASPNYDVRFLLGSDVAAGALADIDLFVVPGGWSLTQMKSLGAVGCSNLVNWVRGGGAYYGTCAGAYLVGQSNATRTYIGLTPYRPQACPYRGNSTDVKCAFSDDGRKALGLSAKEFTTLYWGGPVFERASETALPDSDIRTFATYASQNVYSFSTNTIPAMGGRAAIVGGTLGKGRILTIATHPEYLGGSRHVVRAGLKYLTGKSAEGKMNPHVRGGLALGFYCADFSTREIGDLAVKLMGLPGVDLEDVSSGKLQDGTLDHLDAVVLPVPDKEACNFLKAFASRGGKVYACCRTKKQRDAVKAFSAGSVIICDDENAIVKALEKTR